VSLVRRAALPLDRQCELAGLPIPTPEYQFAKHLTTVQLASIRQVKPRKWALDWAFLDCKIALEVEGGYAIGGRHTSAKGFLGDQEKYNALTCLGWRLLRVTPRDVASGAALSWIDLALKGPTYVRVI
jgi:very-short-patch-repair endonuclease